MGRIKRVKPLSLETLPRFKDAIIKAVLEAADPASAVRNASCPDDLSRGDLHIFATGKASAPMLEAALDRFSPRIRSAIITCIPAHQHRIQTFSRRVNIPIQIYPTDHPLPTQRNISAAKAIAAFAKSRTKSDTVLTLISGGASAHLCLPAKGISLDDLTTITNTLLRAGATINDLNTVRKHLEQLKGGRLARLLSPARTHALVLSDVLGDHLETIASGPTAPDPSTYSQALQILKDKAHNNVPPSIIAHLQAGAVGDLDETPKPNDIAFNRVNHQIIANNQAAQIAAMAALKALQIPVCTAKTNITGEAAAVAKRLIKDLNSAPAPCAVVYAGETTVTVGDATGLGGRNQELALAAAIELKLIPNSAVLTLATDGVDGPTNAAGALVTHKTTQTLYSLGIDPINALKNHDSNTALSAAGAIIQTGPTGTNINDIAIAVRW